MKKWTRILAWLHIIGDIPAMTLLLLLVLIGGLTLGGVAHDITKHSLKDSAVVGGVIIGFILVVALLVLMDVLPWWYLLKKRLWAWWYLTILYGACTSLVLRWWIPFPRPGEPLKQALSMSAEILLFAGLPFLILVTDKPKQRKTSTRRRRRSTASTRRRYTRRRRRADYDY
jgi:uncharacterized membrane protein YedE/YeeE